LDLKSISDQNVLKVLKSSGTSNQQPSKIYLDIETSRRQTTTMIKILQSFLGVDRKPLLIIDTASITNNKSLSTRGAGVIGLSSFGRDITYALDDNYEINRTPVIEFLEKNKKEKILIFGFTYMIWKYLILENDKNKFSFDFSNATLIHGGGWKKLHDSKVDNDIFKNKLNENFGIKNIHNFYGMAEQIGSIFVECQYGRLHAPMTSDIIIRNPHSLSKLNNHEIGLIQLFSTIPYSYPGHSILTEDLGKIIGEDDCDCGRNGKTIEIIGRIKEAELRGCSDTIISTNEKNSSLNILPITQTKSIENFLDVNTISPFHKNNIEFVNEFSKNLFKNDYVKNNSELSYLAYWMRKSQIKEIEKEYVKLSSNYHLAPQGIIFHIAPSNVDTMFVYSWILSLLCGNKSIVKVSSNETINSNILLNEISKIFKKQKWKNQAQKSIFVRYDNDYENNMKLSKICQLRVIWGGDETINKVRECALPAKSKEIVFSDKFSLSIINSKKLINEESISKLIIKFFNDTIPFNQLACSSPKLIVWVGDKKDISEAKKLFWGSLEDYEKNISYNHPQRSTIDKLAHTHHILSNQKGDVFWSNNRRFIRINPENINLTYQFNHPGMGLFYEKDIPSIFDIPSILPKNSQTLTQYGFNKEEIKALLVKNPSLSVHRIVDIGEALHFSHVWDGFSLINEMTKIINY